MRNLFIKTLIAESSKNDRIWLITSDLGFSALEPFIEEFPNRFLNVGIAEQNAVGIAAGLALIGKIPYVYSIIPFVTSRPFEQVKVDCAYMNTNVRLVGVGAGFAYGPAGATHHSTDDLAIMRVLPNMSVLAPGTLNEAEALVRCSIHHEGPIYIRLSKKSELRFDYEVKFGKISTILDGDDFAIISTSSMIEDAIKTAQEFQKEGKKPLLLSVHTIKPFDKDTILRLVLKNIPIITIEEHSVIGGLASAVSEVIANSGIGGKFLPIGVLDEFSHFIGSQNYIKGKMGLTNLKHRIERILE